MRNKIRSTKKYISKEMAIQKLRVTPKNFENLVVLCKVFPVFADKKKCLDQMDDIYYMIDDIRKIGYSNAYERFMKNKSYIRKKEKYMKLKRFEKANKFFECDYNYVQLIKEQYDSFGDCLNAVGEAISNLYLIKMINIENIFETIIKWEEFCSENRLIEKAFLGRKGVYCSFKTHKIRVLWCIPYPPDNLKDKFEIKQDLIKKIKIEPLKIGDYEDEEYEESEEKYINPNFKNKSDISLLKHGAKLYATHVELIINKMKNMIVKKSGLFNNFKIYIAINSIKKHLEFILNCMGCKLVSEEEADIIITESVDIIRKDVIYVQAQYIIDSLNKNEILDWKEYMIGKKVPKHISPFDSINDFIDERVFKSLSNNRKDKISSKIINYDQNYDLY